MPYTKKHVCTKCTALSSENGVPFCLLGYQTTVTDNVCRPMEPCPKPRTEKGLADLMKKEETTECSNPEQSEDARDIQDDCIPEAVQVHCNEEPIRNSASENRTHNKIAYLIDSENMGRDWISLLREDDPSKEYYLFASEKSTTVTIYDLPVICRIMGEDRIKIIPCVVGTPNAMDFQILFLAGQLSRDEPDTEIYIFSRDHDYDCVIRNDSLVQGTIIGRTTKPICPVTCEAAKPEAVKPEAPKSEKKKATPKPRSQKQIKASQIGWLQTKFKSFGFNDEQSTWATTYIYSLIRNGSISPVTRLTSLEKNLKKKYGSDGEELYRKNEEKLNQLLTGKNIFPI